MFSPSSSTELFHIGERLTDYANVDVTVARAAHGGFGAVAMGPDQNNGGRWSALKILHPDLLVGRELRAQERLRNLFLRDALTWIGLWRHPNVLAANFVTRVNGHLTLVLDYAEQGSLRDLFESARTRGTWFAIATALHLAQQIASGLVALHTPDSDLLRPDPIVHRDLKPENIVLSRNRAMITDFGLAKAVAQALNPSKTPGALSASSSNSSHIPTLQAKLAETGAPAPDTHKSEPVSGPVSAYHTQAYRTRRGAALGTPAYMAPEQWADASLAREPADAYAFGIILAELLTSRHPLLSLGQLHSLDAWRQAHLTGQPFPLRQLGAPLFAVQRAALSTSAEQANLDAALIDIDALVVRLLAKEPTARPRLSEAFTELQSSARRLSEEPYTPPDNFYPNTSEHERRFWLIWAEAYRQFDLNSEALPRIERAKAIAPHHPDILSAYGNILTGLGRMVEAEAAFRQTLAAPPPMISMGAILALSSWVSCCPRQSATLTLRTLSRKR